jgi:hydrogenase large subunit
MASINIDPVNRIEGHQKWEVTTDAFGYVTSAKVRGMMFRGWEKILVGRDPRDAMIICGRI